MTVGGPTATAHHRPLRVRPAAVAGTFYTADPLDLQTEVEAHLAAAAPRLAELGETGPTPLHALVVPHAGHRYSGPVAAAAYARLADRDTPVQRVVLLGPAHVVPLRGLGSSTADAWVTPLGRVLLDTAEAARLVRLFAQVRPDDAAHAPEHSLEVQLPFLQTVLGEDGWRLVPLIVGRAGVTEVAAVVTDAWRDPGTLVVVSTDLSHYLPYEVARACDAATAAHVVAGRWEELSDNDACGAYPLRGLLAAARERGLLPRLLDLRSSGDTTGPRDRVVGYGAFVA